MPKPRVFVSSTYYDLKHVRASTEAFIQSIGFEAVLFERGDVAYDPNSPLDDSCYREAGESDIFVLIIGGRYGSAASSEPKDLSADEHFASVTSNELRRAIARNVPTYVLVDSGVYNEYYTYLKNKGDAIKFAHADSVNVYLFLEEIRALSRNNPIQSFDNSDQIAQWLRQQWAGLFRELLRRSKIQVQLDDIAQHIKELKETSSTLKEYATSLMLEENLSVKESKVKDEEARLEKERVALFVQNSPGRYLTGDEIGLDPIESASIVRSAVSFQSLRDLFSETSLSAEKKAHLAGIIRDSELFRRHINEARQIFELPPLVVPADWKYPSNFPAQLKTDG